MNIIIIQQMDELKQIIVYKLRFMAEYQTKIEQQKNDDHVEQLLKQKKKQNSRQVIESRLLQTLVVRKVQAPYRLQQFLADSQKWMKIYDPSFQFTQSYKDDMFMNITNIYVSFFEKQKCQRRAEQIKHIYDRKLCQKSFLIPTIFNWFVEWVRKTFSSFIKANLTRLSDTNSNNTKRTSQKKAKKLSLDKWIEDHRKSIKNIQLQLKNHHNSSGLYIKKSQLLTPGSVNVLKSKRSLSIPFDSANIVKEEKEQEKSKLISSPLIAKQSPIIVKEDSVFTGLNKQIFYSSFGEQLTTYYKFVGEMLPDIDISYLKTHRRNDKRAQIKNKVEELAKSIARGQTQIKKSIELYYQQYSKKFSKKKVALKEKQQTDPKVSPIKKVRSKSRVSQQLEKIGEEEQFEKFRKKQENQNQSLMKNRKSKSLNPRHELQKKHALVQLPEISKNTSAKNQKTKLKKILFASSNRYAGIVSLQPEEPHTSKMKKYNTSRQRTISELKQQDFHNSSHQSIKKFKAARMNRSINQSMQQKSHDIMSKQNPIQTDSQFNTDDQSQEQEGVFYLPKIRT